MKRIDLAVVVVLLYSSVMLAQHSSGSGGGSSSSSAGGGGSHASSSVGSSSSGSSGSYSSGGPTSSGSGHSFGSSGSAAGSHSSGSFVSHGSGSSTGSVSRGGGVGTGSFLRPGSELSRSSGVPAFSSRTESVTLDQDTGKQVQQMMKTGKSLEEIRQFVHTKTGADPDKRPIRTETNEKRSFLSALRHPLQKPRTAVVADLRHRICVNNTCRVCPAGSSVNGKGGCTGPSTNLCASGSYWSGNGCQVLGQTWRYLSCRYDDSDLILARQRMRIALAERQAACSLDPAGQSCSEKNIRYQRAVADYNLRSRWQRTGGFQRCLEGSAFGFFDPINLEGPAYGFVEILPIN